MHWFKTFLSSSIGKKLIMSLTGLFLMVFLLIHLMGNLQLLKNDDGEQFNLYAMFMTSNPVIKTISYLLYFFILLHSVQGVMLWRQNRAARKSRYAIAGTKTSTFASRNMGFLGMIIFVFLILHLWQFWFQMKIGALELVSYEGHEPVSNLYQVVAFAFSQWWYVVFYVICMVVVAYHLLHGFQSAFQTLGLNHPKYTPLIKWVGVIYGILVPLGFAIIPILFYLSL